MDTKLKNSYKKQFVLTALGLAVLVLGIMCSFPYLRRQAEAISDAQEEESSEAETAKIDTDLVAELYESCYVLYAETEGETDHSENLFLTDDAKTSAAALETADAQEETDEQSELAYQMQLLLTDWSNAFDELRQNIDYSVVSESRDCVKNHSQNLEAVFESGADAWETDELTEYYSDYIALDFDSEGKMTVVKVASSTVDTDDLLKALLQAERENSMRGSMQSIFGEETAEAVLAGPQDFRVVFGIPKGKADRISLVATSSYDDAAAACRTKIADYADAGANVIFALGIALTAVFAAVMTSPRIWKDGTLLRKTERFRILELLVVVFWCLLALFLDRTMVEKCMDCADFDAFFAALRQNPMGVGETYALRFLFYYVIYAAWYVCFAMLRPLVALGLCGYVRRYSLLYWICCGFARRFFPWLKQKCVRFSDEVRHIDFSQKSYQTILKLVLLNFIVPALFSCLWFFGIPALAIYSVVLFFAAKRYYDRTQRDYQRLLLAAEALAVGNLDAEMKEDFGIFEPVKEKLSLIQEGFRTAVEQEVKSQRMKTDLITNVSHDLKTPLTAITTYVELLKKEDITEEERRSYIDTLDKKAQRLKALIEDLFDISKATSNNITLRPMEVDVGNLLKQVAIEHREAYEKRNLLIRWNLPEEKAVAWLDNQKTYRIFENLFQNIQKYAMEGSRVYIAAEKKDGVTVTMKNISAVELNIAPEELTERFVRGDASRNTEGSGLGLAIARSFVEAQGGTFRIEVDGDLFKVIIHFSPRSQTFT